MQKKEMNKGYKVSIASIAVNIVLSLLKLAAGYIGHSQAMIADAIHSASDVLTTLIVMVSLAIAGKPADADHEYGHQKFESFAGLILGLLLAQVGLKLGYDGIRAIVTGSYVDNPTPDVIAIAAAAISIVVKEIMYRITMKIAREENSQALRADAWHHRSDALSSVGSMIGVAFAMAGYPIMDSIACIIICVFILKTAVEVVIDVLKSLTDASCSKDKEEDIRREVMSVEGVEGVDLLRTRVFGSGFYVDVEISVDGNKMLKDSHAVAEAVHDTIEARFTDALHCMVHVNPRLTE